jgi:hypothetical protein
MGRSAERGVPCSCLAVVLAGLAAACGGGSPASPTPAPTPSPPPVVAYQQLPAYSIYSIYSNVDLQVAARPFRLSSALSIDRIRWWGHYRAAMPASFQPGPFQIVLYGEHPASGGDRALLSVEFAVTMTRTGRTIPDGSPFAGFPVFQYDAVYYRGIPLAADKEYWISIAESNHGSGRWLWSASFFYGEVSTTGMGGGWLTGGNWLPSIWLAGPGVTTQSARTTPTTDSFGSSTVSVEPLQAAGCGAGPAAAT